MATAKILLVDDTRLFLELEKNFLRMSTAHILTAGNGEEALEIVRRERPDLIYMDLNMPKMDGATCCAALKADPALRSIPVIMVTSAGKEEDIRTCREAGCDDFLTKPINRGLFLEKGRKFLKGIDHRESRMPCSMPVKLRAHNLSLTGISADISRRGIYVASDYELEEKAALELSFTLPETGCALSGIKGLVAWRNGKSSRVKPSMPPGFGVEFINLQDETAAIIGAYMGVGTP